MKAALEINGEKCLYPEAVTDLEKLLLFLMEKEVSDRGVIVEVKVDGALYSEDYAHQAQEVPLASLEKVEITTLSLREFAQEFLLQAPKYMVHLERGFSEAAQLMRSPEREENGYELLARSLEGLGAFKTHMRNVNQVLGNDDTTEAHQDFWERFDLMSARIIDAQVEANLHSIGDLLESEMLPLLKEWREGMRIQG